MGLDVKTLAAAKSYVKETLNGSGALRGEPGKDAPKIVSMNVDENNVLSVEMSDGEILECGKIKILQSIEILNCTMIQGIL